ncbi:hypothetical protein ABZ502_29995 [Streptomyces abikoensis]|uniref:hypothetical protein n=1 Tax=Streptomyces abikoensis TaxID=97398 RepID=UPI0033FE2DCE
MSEQTEDDHTSETNCLAYAEDEPFLQQERPLRLFLPSETADPHANVNFPPVENGVDYLVSVADHLVGEGPPTPRDIKYAVLHLQAAAEVLLKARLQREHWSLVFKDPGTATREKFEKGDFESCTTDAALDRLKRIVGIPIDDKAAADIKSLVKSRNALQHYGLTAPARAVEARAASVLDFLLAFVYDHLLPQLTREEAAGIVSHLDGVSETVRELQSFLTKRRNRLRGELKDCQDRTLKCPDCAEWALVVGEGTGPTCRFCHIQWPDGNDFLIGNWIAEYRRTCPQCAEHTLIPAVSVAADKRLPLCFGCGTVFEDLVECDNCTELTEPSDTGMCSDCLAARFAKF